MKIKVRRKTTPESRPKIHWRGKCAFCGRTLEQFGRYHNNCRILSKYAGKK